MDQCKIDILNDKEINLENNDLIRIKDSFQISKKNETLNAKNIKILGSLKDKEPHFKINIEDDKILKTLNNNTLPKKSNLKIQIPQTNGNTILKSPSDFNTLTQKSRKSVNQKKDLSIIHEDKLKEHFNPDSNLRENKISTLINETVYYSIPSFHDSIVNNTQMVDDLEKSNQTSYFEIFIDDNHEIIKQLIETKEFEKLKKLENEILEKEIDIRKSNYSKNCDEMSLFEKNMFSNENEESENNNCPASNYILANVKLNGGYKIMKESEFMSEFIKVDFCNYTFFEKKENQDKNTENDSKYFN